MDKIQDKLGNERYGLNNLLSDPQPNDIIWRSQVIVALHNVAQILGLELKELKKKP